MIDKNMPGIFGMSKKKVVTYIYNYSSSLNFAKNMYKALIFYIF